VRNAGRRHMRIETNKVIVLFTALNNLRLSISSLQKIQQNGEEKQVFLLIRVRWSSSALVLVHFVKGQWNRLYGAKLACVVQMLILQPEIFEIFFSF
jgi:hypothetical protein